ncbi:toxin HipA [Frondihabitans sp. PAMC 28766]|uniref:type II toxin-antitoxin system HipA family toxin n=1 Tax=Frondihabitans sp. PAMC 28766 TaxID=1795630 RepID=UPI00078D086A|nr:HipA domain-containing protein [Frondihabitans sp. PAMC 28766]AMM19094.1 toxin HipA [Frondihabitans sp. PAMC 28766]
MADLTVELYGTIVGELVGTSPRTFDFRSASTALETFGLGSTVLSEAVPFDVVPNRGRAAHRRNFFTELLPEDNLRTYLARQAGLSEADTIGLLSHYGRDVAGALQVWDPDNPGEPRTPFANPIDDDTIADLLRDARTYPLGNSVETGKSLINGVQTKIVLVREDDRWKRPEDGFPSTHILKPRLDDTSTIVFDEEYGSRLARLLGLATHATWIDRFDDVDTLVVERYDRSASSPDGRIHQEDMNQVLGASGPEKYQKLGGRVSSRRIAHVLRTVTDADSLLRFARLTVLAAAVGDLDLHAKNVSLLHPFEAPRSLAPAYDVVPMAHLDNDHEMALAVNGVYSHAAITIDDLISETEGWGLRDARAVVLDSVAEIRSLARVEAPLAGSWSGLQEDIASFTENLLAGRAIGGSRQFGAGA